MSGLGYILGQSLHTAHGLHSICNMVVNRPQASHLLLWLCGNAAVTVNLLVVSGSFFALGQHWRMLLQMVWPIQLTAFTLWPFTGPPLFLCMITVSLGILSTFSLHTWSRKMWTGGSDPKGEKRVISRVMELSLFLAYRCWLYLLLFQKLSVSLLQHLWLHMKIWGFE